MIKIIDNTINNLVTFDTLKKGAVFKYLDLTYIKSYALYTTGSKINAFNLNHYDFSIFTDDCLVREVEATLTLD